MKIAFFTDDYLPYVHGVTTSIQNYRAALEALGHEVFIVAPKKPGYDDHDDHVIRLPSVNSFIFDKRPISLAYPGLARRLDKYHFDIVHSQTQFYMGVLAGQVAKRQNIPHFMTVHTLFTELADDYPLAVTAGLIAVSIGFPFIYKTRPVLPFRTRQEILELSQADRNEIKKKQGWRLIAEIVNQADAGVAPSRHLANTLHANGTTAPLHILPNGISLERYKKAKATDSPLQKKPGERIIISVARVSGEKRPQILVEAMRHVKASNTRLVMVGDGPMLDKLDTYIETHGLADKVVLMGMQNATAVASLLKQADAFALASYRFDNQPMVILEAIASGLPVVYCDDHLTEGLTPENALLTSGRSGKAFAKAFDELLSDDNRRKKMARASLRVAQEFDSLKLATRLVERYQKAIDAYYE